MKKKISALFGIMLSAMIVCMAALTGCSGSEDGAAKEHIIQYTDEAGLHTLTVTEGLPYSLESIPEKTGYTFLGLYDAETGGTQYVSNTGLSVSPYNDKKDKILYPQYEAKEYNIILDYQGAPVTGERQLKVKYDSELPELPKNLTLAHKDFKGWYTEENCSGKRISDEYGNIPVVSVLNSSNFSLPGNSLNVYLYAGFEIRKYTVNMYSEDGQALLKTQTVADGTAFDAVNNKIFVGDKTVTGWSKEIGGTPFSGEVTENLNLYAISYGITVSYDNQDGSDVRSSIISIGSSVTPTPLSRTGYTFLGWYDETGSKIEGPFTPAGNTLLTARWEANVYKVTLNPQGGNVNEPSQAVSYGSSFSLQVPTRNGYLFKGWYTAADGGVKITDETGTCIEQWNRTNDLTVFADWSKLEYEMGFSIRNCAQDNGYNTAKQDTDDRAGRHDGFEMVRLTVQNAEKLDNGKYRVPTGYSLTLSLKVMQDMNNLPLNGNAQSKKLSDDGYTGYVWDTNINNKKIGYGAYYVCINYTDGNKTERNAANILYGKNKNDIIRLDVTPDTDKSISSVSVTVVYEIYSGGPGAFGIWWQEHSNWRCSTTLTFA
ncbi:MAG: InlB B-repeat-containing protein [Clostridia bacterium]|nr:InlB B-repeat-containing protein [Clostridia bacterium]